MGIVRVLKLDLEKHEDSKSIGTNLLVACYYVSEFSYAPFIRNVKEHGSFKNRMVILVIRS